MSNLHPITISSWTLGDQCSFEERVQAAKKAVQKIGIAKMALVVFSRNQSGNAFWEKQGFSAREDLTYRNLALQEMTRMDT